MKRIAKTFFACLIIVAMMLSFSACNEVENGSKIQRMYIELEFLNASGEVVDTQKVQTKLYLNFAPKTTEHFISLAEEGYYDGVTISHVNSNWCEFGGYTRTADGKLEKKAYDGDTVDGEFKNNGLIGNKLPSSGGVLIMKRNYNNESGSQYNTATNTIIMTFNAVSRFNASEYCVFGKICTDDGDVDLQNSVSNSISRVGLTSKEIADTISASEKNEDGDFTYYYENYETLSENSEYASINSQYYTVDVDDEGVTHYYKGSEINADYEIEGEDLTLFRDMLSKEANYFLTIPYTEVRIKSIRKA